MTASSLAVELPPSAPSGGEPVQWYARLAGVLGFVSLVAGGFGEGYVPEALVVAGNAAATARNILDSETLFRWGFAGYLVEAICDAALTMLFWVLVRPVHRNLAMLMVVFRIISTCGFGSAEVLYFGGFATLSAAQQLTAFGPAQLEALAFVLIKVASFGGALFSMFYGLAGIVFGYLLVRSLLIPRILGILMTIMGVAFTLRTFLLVLAPEYASPYLLVTAVAILPLSAWLLVKGVNVSRWQRYAEA